MTDPQKLSEMDYHKAMVRQAIRVWRNSFVKEQFAKLPRKTRYRRLALGYGPVLS